MLLLMNNHTLPELLMNNHTLADEQTLLMNLGCSLHENPNSAVPIDKGYLAWFVWSLSNGVFSLDGTSRLISNG